MLVHNQPTHRRRWRILSRDLFNFYRAMLIMDSGCVFCLLPNLMYDFVYDSRRCILIYEKM